MTQFSWLNLRKTLKQQLKEGPYTFFFFVKFFPPDPCTLQEDLTRYSRISQIFVCSGYKGPYFHGDVFFPWSRLVCPPHTQLLLSSFIVQAEFGDWNPDLRKSKYLNGLKFIPNQVRFFVKARRFRGEISWVSPRKSGINSRGGGTSVFKDRQGFRTLWHWNAWC